MKKNITTICLIIRYSPPHPKLEMSSGLNALKLNKKESIG